ncbi:hypothetical protein BSM4216_3344 [Bacillus smithii]|nr:hypothetical protein BSM4216_3344 [Bacillus smithii]
MIDSTGRIQRNTKRMEINFTPIIELIFSSVLQGRTSKNRYHTN